jgi:hypothetical protein
MTRDGLKATPGPWALSEQPRWPFDIHIDAGKENVVTLRRAAYSTAQDTLADVKSGKGFKGDERGQVVAAVEGQLATAHLIASAPELYDALLNTLAVAKLKWGNLDEDVNVIFKQAESAVAKARGETP